jgi:hypothetical protein
MFSNTDDDTWEVHSMAKTDIDSKTLQAVLDNLVKDRAELIRKMTKPGSRTLTRAFLDVQAAIEKLENMNWKQPVPRFGGKILEPDR